MSQETGAGAGGTSDPGTPDETIRDVAARLRELAQRLADPEVADEQAAELAREAADLVSEAGNEIDRALRESDAGG